LRVLSSGVLKRDICGLREPGTLINSIEKDQVNHHLPSKVQYICQYWTRHLQQLDSDRQENIGLKDGGQVHILLQENFLYWLKALGLMGKVSKGILMIQGLKSMLKAYTLIVSDSTTLQSSWLMAKHKSGANSLLLAMIRDAHCFISFQQINNQGSASSAILLRSCFCAKNEHSSKAVRGRDPQMVS
jgi:hypothetical protein